MIGLLNKTATITPYMWAVNANGHDVRTAGSTVSAPCALQTLSADERERYAKLQESEVMVLYLPAGTAIDSKATVTVDGKTYEVRSIPEDMGGRGRGLRVVVERVP